MVLRPRVIETKPVIIGRAVIRAVRWLATTTELVEDRIPRRGIRRTDPEVAAREIYRAPEVMACSIVSPSIDQLISGSQFVAKIERSL